MSLQFYMSIIEDEKKIFNVKEESLKIAAKDVATTYSTKALKDGSTFLDYNNPRNRCAYMYKYSTIHTDLVNKYFKCLINHNGVRTVLDYKKDIKICCLGGGAGTDIVGIFKVLATFSSFEKKVTQVTVLDLCGGWRNSFKHIISRLKHGKVENVPASFIDSSNFKADLIEVNLLEPLPANVVKVISNADIVCMVKFVSAVLGKQGSVTALKAIGDNIKLGAIVLVIDNFQKNIIESLEGISKQCGFSTVLGPLYKKHKRPRSHSKKAIYGCLPLNYTTVSVIGWIKTHVIAVNTHNISERFTASSSNEDNDDNWDTDNESEDFCSIPLQENATIKLLEPTFRNKFTQTEMQYLNITEDVKEYGVTSDEMTELPALIEAFNDLLRVITHLKRIRNKHECCPLI